MKHYFYALRLILIFCFVLPCSTSECAVIFDDGFESGDLSNSYWGAATRVVVSQDQAKTGGNSARFHFSAGRNGFSELRFDLGALYQEVWIKFYLYIPLNYAHANTTTTNNKFFRLWPDDYDDCEKIGASTLQQGDGVSSLSGEWNKEPTCPGIGARGASSDDFIASADKGNWMEVIIQAIASTSAANPGTLKIWKNGTLIIDNTQTVNNYNAANAHAYRYGYLLGWANGGFVEDTDLYIDDVVFATTEADVNSGSSQPAQSKQFARYIRQ